MKKKFTLPLVPKEQQTPLVNKLLSMLEELITAHQKQAEENAFLKDEINILKGEKTRPIFKPSRLDKETDINTDNALKKVNETKRPGSEKKPKTKNLVIHNTAIIEPEEPLPAGSIRNGYRDVVIQDIKFEASNTCYRLARWTTPDGEKITAKLPDNLRNTRFGLTLQAYLLYQHYHCHVTQPLLHEQLSECGIDISTGQINRILIENKDLFHAESDGVLAAGLRGKGYIGVDDTGGRHQGKNGFVTCISNQFFAWFKQTHSKSRINFLTLLGSSNEGYFLNEAAFIYLQQQNFPKGLMEPLKLHEGKHFEDALKYVFILNGLGVLTKKQLKTAMEAALIGALFENKLCQDLVIISDGAGQFNILLHALCWVHTERLIHKLIPLNDQHRADIALVRGQVWDLYRALKHYKKNPTEDEKERIKKMFDGVFQQKTSYELLNQQLKRIRRNKSQLLLVLEHPHIPLNTNFVEGDIREWVKKRKISGGTRSENGRHCRDTFATLKKTCRKLGISFWDYLLCRFGIGKKTVPYLGDIVGDKMGVSTGY